jgi:hypothetical protein
VALAPQLDKEMYVFWEQLFRNDVTSNQPVPVDDIESPILEINDAHEDVQFGILDTIVLVDGLADVHLVVSERVGHVAVQYLGVDLQVFGESRDADGAVVV